MLQDEQKNMAENPQVSPDEKPADSGANHVKEVEKLKQQLAEAEARLAGAETEAGQELKQEAASAQAEGQISKEAQNAFSTPAPPVIQTLAQSAQATDSENRVNALCELAFQKGLDDAIKAARDLNDPYILDEFHDALVDKFYKQMVEKKKIEEV